LPGGGHLGSPASTAASQAPQQAPQPGQAKAGASWCRRCDVAQQGGCPELAQRQKRTRTSLQNGWHGAAGTNQQKQEFIKSSTILRAAVLLLNLHAYGKQQVGRQQGPPSPALRRKHKWRMARRHLRLLHIDMPPLLAWRPVCQSRWPRACVLVLIHQHWPLRLHPPWSSLAAPLSPPSRACAVPVSASQMPQMRMVPSPAHVAMRCTAPWAPLSGMSMAGSAATSQTLDPCPDMASTRHTCDAGTRHRERLLREMQLRRQLTHGHMW
jgi:hypothetical protein